MSEIELKFQLPPAGREALLTAVGHRKLVTVALAARYFDTADQLLARHRIALRLRSENGRWVQTLKASTAHAAERLEDNVDIPPGDAADDAGPRLDPARHAGTPAGERLAKLLKAHGHPELAEVFRTEVSRQLRRLHTHGADVEWALDEGRVVAGPRAHAISELELEWKGGDVAGLYAAARDWQARHGLWLDVVSKAERGALLSAGRPAGVPVKAEAPALARGMDGAALLRAIVAACLAQILPNASAVAGGGTEAGHVHQLRVGLRRLRTALRELDVFAGGLPATCAAAVDAVFAAAGEARDRHLMLTSLAQRLDRAGAPPADAARARAGGQGEGEALAALAAQVRGAAFQATLLHLLEFAHVPARATAVPGADAPEAAVDLPAPPEALAHVRERLRKLRRQVVRDAAHFEALPLDDQHRVRKRLKRLRYLAGFVAPLFGRRRVAAWLAAVEPAQDALGAHIDQALAARRFERAAATDARAWFAVGWLRARLGASARDSRRALEKLRKADVFW